MKQLFLLLLLAAAVASAQPQEGREGDDRRPRQMRRSHIESLNLNDDQQKQFDKLQTDLQKKQIELRAKVQSLRVDLRSAFREDNPNQGKIESTLNEIGKLQNQMKLLRFAQWFSVNKMLTPEQQKIWKQRPMLDEEGGMGPRKMRSPRMKMRGDHMGLMMERFHGEHHADASPEEDEDKE